jgi:hypothetical protein
MKRMAFLASLVVLVFAVGLLAQQTTFTPRAKAVSAEQELLKLEDGWANAEVKADVAFLDKILADDWELTGADGVVLPKAQYLASLKSGDNKVSSEVDADMKARVYGDAAVVTGIVTVKETDKGKDVSGRYRGTDTWIKKAGRWQCVATQISRVAEK